MSGDTTADVEKLIERLRTGDDSARRALLERVVQRLDRIARAVLHKEFPRLLPRHEVDSIVDEAWMRLMKALETLQPESAQEFYSLMFHKVRQVLLDMARRQTRDDLRAPQQLPNPEASSDSPGDEGGDTSHDPARLALWTEFHHQVDRLPDDQRMVFDFHYYADISQAEIARLLDLHPRQVSRLWLAATGQLGHWLRGIENAGF